MDYDYYKNSIVSVQKPILLADMDALDSNIALTLARNKGKKIRIASKSIRSTHILSYILEKSDIFQGIMCFTATEAVFLSEKGFDDLLLGYPCMDEETIQAVGREVQKGKKIIFMVDALPHLAILQKQAEKLGIQFSVCIDIDMSVDFPGLHFGVWRSSLRNIADVKAFVTAAKTFSHIKIEGLMGYEAQIAGVADNSPFQGMKNYVIRLLKKLSHKKYITFREEAVKFIASEGIALSFVNGGGTGSMEWTGEEDVVTEITVGSGFFASHLFDYYQHFHYKPALFFALPIVRMPKKGIYTCLGGGYIASGSTGLEKNPQVFLPKGAQLTDLEGAGEVMTPVLYNGELQIGDPIFFRHAKAGEICERFGEIHLISKGEIVGKCPTYRGEGGCFL